MMTAQEFDSLMDDFAAALEAVEHGASVDVGALCSFLVRNPNLVTLIREREQDTHDRVRRGYDKTVADCWRAEVEKRDERIAKLELLLREAEHAGVAYHEDGDSAGSDACPWCCVEVENERIIHAADCPAFSAPGEVRR